MPTFIATVEETRIRYIVIHAEDEDVAERLIDSMSEAELQAIEPDHVEWESYVEEQIESE